MMDEPEDPGGSPPITVDDQQGTPVDTGALRSAANAALRALDVPEEAALSVILVDAERMAELKHQAFGVRAPTDVLSFPIDDPSRPAPGPVVLGDLVLCPEVAAQQARALGRSLDRELDLLLVHGLLHLTGHDHADVASELAMAARERDLLAAVGGVSAR